MINEELKINIENFILDLNSKGIYYKANDKYIGVAFKLVFKSIFFYNLNIKNEYFELKINFLLFELNQKYPNVLAISKDNFIEIYELPNSFNKSTIKLTPKIRYKITNTIYDISFNPKYSHIMAIISTDKCLYIWNNKQIHIKCNFSFISYLDFFKWEKNGYLCAFCEKDSIKVFNIKENRLIFKYDISKLNDFKFEFLNEEQIIILCYEEQIIKIISLKDNQEKIISLFFYKNL